MERKTVTAIILTLAILAVYNAYISKKVEKKKAAIKTTQPLENKEVKTESKSPKSILPPLPYRPEQKEALVQVETESLVITFSDIGGTIKHLVDKQYHYEFPLTNIGELPDFHGQTFVLTKKSPQEVIYVYDSPSIRVEKRYHIGQNPNKLQISISVQNKTPNPLSYQIKTNVFTIDTQNMSEKVKKSRDKSLYEYSIALPEKVIRKGGAFRFSPKEEKDGSGPLDWVGFRSRYYCGILKPLFNVSHYNVKPIGKQELTIKLTGESTEIPPKTTKTFSFVGFFGLQSTEILKSVDTDFTRIVAFSNFRLLNFISLTIVKVLKGVHKIIPNWGACIILVSILIYLLLYPLTIKGLSSMKKMQAIQPKITQLREKYKNNPQRLNKEIMELYRENKVNPLGGCAPLLLQMPIFIGLYQTLWRSVIFKGAHFLWIKDLSEPDRLFTFSTKLPLIGNEFNLLPVLMMVVMFFQQKLSAKNMVSTDPAQQSQQRMMMIFFPVFLGIIFYKFASGLTLYFTVFYLLSTVSQWRINRVFQ